LLEQRLHLHDRPHLDRAAHARGRDACGKLDRGVEVVGLEQEVAADRLLELNERTVGSERLAVLDPNCRRRLGGWSWLPAVTCGSWPIATYSA